MRGKRHHLRRRFYVPGITPAYAGKSFPCDVLGSVKRDHPRICGEKKFSLNTPALEVGSPPRVRGKVQGQLLQAVEVGITPAYAGKSRKDWTVLPASRDHPRVCGEKTAIILAFDYCNGSPPRMRGKAAPKNVDCDNLRITPAYAGKSRTDMTISVHSKDHPRVCGEKLFFGACGRHRSRITPAYAGKSFRRLFADYFSRDHPRVCGEKTLSHIDHWRGLGSPPRMRGKV